MHISIKQCGNDQQQNAHIIKFVKKRVSFVCGEKFLHEQHVHQDARVLHDKIEIGFLEKTKPTGMITMNGFYKKHHAEEKSIARIKEKLRVASL